MKITLTRDELDQAVRNAVEKKIGFTPYIDSTVIYTVDYEGFVESASIKIEIE